MAKLQLHGLGKDKEVLVDQEDLSFLGDYRWYWTRMGGKTGYVHGYTALNPKKRVQLHRLILEKAGYQVEGKVVDHINRNGLDNRKENLRLTTAQGNQLNRGANKNNSTLYKGVHYLKKAKLYQASLVIRGKKMHLGYFKDPKQASLAYESALKKQETEVFNQ